MSASLSPSITTQGPSATYSPKSSEKTVALEFIIVNDGSTDGTGRLVQDICDDRLILIEQENQEVSSAHNAS